MYKLIYLEENLIIDIKNVKLREGNGDIYVFKVVKRKWCVNFYMFLVF